MTEPVLPGSPRYPGYDVLDKRHTPSWDDVTRRVIDHRLAVPHQPRFFTLPEWSAAGAMCRRVLPQPEGRPPVPLPALLDAKLLGNSGDVLISIRSQPGIFTTA